MEYQTGVAIIGVMCVVVLIIGILKKRAELLLNFLVRMVLGLVCAYFFNNFLELQGIPVKVGINPLSALTFGTLGSGGFGLLYGISFYHFL